MTIGFKDANENASIVLGKLSGFNLWSYQIKAEEILRMSHGCGGEAGNVKAWETVNKELKKEVAVKWSRSCGDRKGKPSMNTPFPNCYNFIPFNACFFHEFLFLALLEFSLYFFRHLFL